MKNCPTCSAEVPEFVNFCAHCGNTVVAHGPARAANSEQVLHAAKIQAATLAEPVEVPEVIEPGSASPAAEGSAAESDDAPASERDTAAPPVDPAARSSSSSSSNLRLARVAFGLACVPLLANVVGLLLASKVLRHIGADPSADPDAYRLARRAVGIASATIVVLVVFVVASVLKGPATRTPFAFATRHPRVAELRAHARQLEAPTTLRAIEAAIEQRRRRGEPTPHSFADIGFAPPRGRSYAYFFEDDALQPDVGGPYTVSPEIEERAQAMHAHAIAVSNLDRDKTLDVWVLDDEGVPVHLVDDLAQ